ncbi:hypothetical protein COSO111634_35735 [Corallococcus soli]
MRAAMGGECLLSRLKWCPSLRINSSPGHITRQRSSTSASSWKERDASRIISDCFSSGGIAHWKTSTGERTAPPGV